MTHEGAINIVGGTPEDMGRESEPKDEKIDFLAVKKKNFKRKISKRHGKSILC